MQSRIIISLVIGILGCNEADRKSESKQEADTVSISRVDTIQTDTLPAIPAGEIKKENYKSKLATFWEQSKSEFVFNTWLIEISDSDSVRQIKFFLDSISHINPKKDKESFDLSDKWKLKYYAVEGWYGIPDLQIDKRSQCFYSYQNKFSLTGNDLFKIFSLSSKKFPITYIPFIFGRDAKYNKEWTAILLNKNYLLIRLVSSHPDGNQTSCQFEMFYLFEKVFYQN